MRHRFDVTSLLLGLAFGAVAVAALNGWLAEVLVDPDLWTPEVAVATAAVLLGLLLLAAAATVLGRRRAADREVAAGAEPPPEPAHGPGTDA